MEIRRSVRLCSFIFALILLLSVASKTEEVSLDVTNPYFAKGPSALFWPHALSPKQADPPENGGIAPAKPITEISTKRKKRAIFLLPVISAFPVFLGMLGIGTAAAVVASNVPASGHGAFYTPSSPTFTSSGTTMEIVKHPPKDGRLKGFPNAEPVKPKGNRKRWKDSKNKKIYEWDYQHGAVEQYSPRGKHEGEYDADTGEKRKEADPSRRLEDP